MQLRPGLSAGAATMAARNTGQHFRKLQDFKATYCPTRFALYESVRTGMRVVVVDREGPKVNGYFALATEIHDDSGAPHTLEHLIFMGSKNYQYKGILDKLATRAYSNTNAWTATDHTVYTLDTAGWDGFAQILPVYLEHVLFPTLTDAGCYTEVHHVDGEGNDAGVVYSEMQGVQNQQTEIMDLQARRMLYPESVGFRYETGGLMERLRVLSADRIRRFHKDMYQPKNLCLIIIGEVNQPELFEILDKFEDNIIDEIPAADEPFSRPWLGTGKTPQLPKSITDVIEFPENDETIGEILIGYLGPECNDSLLVAAINVLLTYICGSSISLLENTIVEREQLASAVYYSSDSRPDTVIWFTLTGVLTSKLEQVQQRFFEVLREAAGEPFDMTYLRDCLRRFRRQLVYDSENSSNFFGNDIINDHLFGHRDGSDLLDMGTLDEYDTLAKWTETEWKQFYRKWFAMANSVSVLGKPSKKLSKRIKKDEEARIKAQRERLGPEGLKDLQEKLDAAKAENDREIPDDLLNRFDVPPTDSIRFIPTITARSGLAQSMGVLHNPVQQRIDEEKAKLPLFIHFEHIPTSFVCINVILCTHSISAILRPLINLFMTNFFDTPVQRNGARVEFEDVVKQLEKDTIDYSIDSGAGVGNSELIRIRMQIEPEQYEKAIQWLRDLLLHGIFDNTRLSSTLVKLLADIPEQKRSGSGMLSAVSSMIHFSQKSSSRARGTLVDALYLRRILALLKESPEKVIAMLEKFRKSLVTFENIRIFVVANLEGEHLPNPVSAWEGFEKEFQITQPSVSPVDSQASCLTEASRSPGSRAYVVPMHTIDSSFAALVARGINSWEDPRHPALAVTLAYLDATEGPLYVAVRGTGLAYGSGFTRDIGTGLLQYKIWSSPDAYRAYEVSKKTINALATGAVQLDDFSMQGAISSIVVGFADEQPTMASAATVSFMNQVVRGIPKDWGTTFMKAVKDVKKEDVRRILQELVLPVFDPRTSNLVVTCAVIMQENMKTQFEKEGFDVAVQDLSEFQDDYGLEGPEGTEADEADGDEDGVSADEDEVEDEAEDEVEDDNDEFSAEEDDDDDDEGGDSEGHGSVSHEEK